MSNKLPKDWQEVRIGDIAREVCDRNYDGADIPVLSMTKHRGFVRSDQYFSRSVYSENTSQYKLVREGQFAYATIHLDEGSIDFLRTYKIGLISPMYTVFEIVSNEIDKYVLLRNLKRLALSGRFDPYSNGGINRRKSILFSDLAAFKLILPSLVEQQAIASVLSSIDNTIAKSQALCTDLLVATEALTEALCLGIDPMTRERNVNGWRPSTLGAEMSSIQVGIVVKPASYYVEDGGVLALRSLNIRENRIDLNKTVQISDKGHDVNRKSSLRPGDIVTVRTGEPGTTAVVPKYLGALNCIDIIFSRPGPTLRSEYASFFLNSRVAKRQIAVLQGGLAQQHLNVGEMRRIKILVPPVGEQDRIVNILSGMWLRNDAERAALDQLKDVRAVLARELLSGRVRLPGTIVKRHRDNPAQAA